MNPIILSIVVAIVILVIAGWYLLGLKQNEPKAPWKRQLKKNLAKTSSLLNSNNAYSLKQLLIETDKSLDFALKNSMIEGNTMGDRLKASKKLFPKVLYNDIWEAHKMRNKIAHEMDYAASLADLKKAYFDLRKGIDVLMKS